MSKPTPKEMREILMDWYLSVEVQRHTGDVKIRNGVELRMHKIAHRIFGLSLPPTTNEPQK